MTLPSEIRLQASCLGKADLSELIFQVKVHSGTKNPFHIYFPKKERERGGSFRRR
jgi:hypothetical protein